ncbi:hypothetical protein HPB49_006124 [Dermacentor silvarum]|uniref:Uncharacterized protein n=1 Tax=Dermacentor silvarum TaxID=543639 RepID=A0ACB8D2W0_DERSI|nr:hypothetical protein HPB49_006124 [Dermacentor silvarum]
MKEWLKVSGAFGDHDKVVECFGLEQFFRRLPENIRYWVQYRPVVETVARAAELAEEYVSRWGPESTLRKENRLKSDKQERWSRSRPHKEKEKA